MPFGFLRQNDASVYFNLDWQWWGEKKAGVIEMIKKSHENNYQVMLKPQLWLKDGAYTGKLTFNREIEWLEFEKSYAQFILDFAAIAEQNQVELFCIGTELQNVVKQRPKFWQQLILDVRQTYQGKITYAANWDEYSEFPFWQNLDYIGIDAYFPLSQSANPDITELKQAWKKLTHKLEKFSDSLNQKILFTEYGYTSSKTAVSSPWLHLRETEPDSLIQSLALQAMYETIWNEDYLAGGFLWKWFPNHYQVGGSQDNDFTPQNKKSTETIKRYYEKLNSSN